MVLTEHCFVGKSGVWSLSNCVHVMRLSLILVPWSSDG